MSIFSGVFRIGQEPELRHVPSGESVVNLSLACNYGRKDDAGKRPTTWVEAGLWGKRAEALIDYLEKGQQVWCVIEDLHIEQFAKRDGTPGSKLAGRIQRIEFVGPRQDRGDEQRSSAPEPAAAPTPTRRPAPPRPPTGTGFDDMDDDIPF